MEIILYSTNCPRCKVLEKKLTAAMIDFTINTDVQECIDAGFKTAPLLKVNEKWYTFADAVKWIGDHNEY